MNGKPALQQATGAVGGVPEVGLPDAVDPRGSAELHMAPMTPDLAVAGAGFHAGHCACDDCMLLWAVTGSGNKRPPLLPLPAVCGVVFYAPALGTPDQPERVRGLFRCGRPTPCPVHCEREELS